MNLPSGARVPSSDASAITTCNSERNYSIPKLELLAVVTFIEKNKPLLGIGRFVLRCDSKALEFLKTWSLQEGMIARWISRLSSIQYEFLHRIRGKHENADALTKRTQNFVLHQEEAEKGVAAGFPFMSQKQYDEQ